MRNEENRQNTAAREEYIFVNAVSLGFFIGGIIALNEQHPYIGIAAMLLSAVGCTYALKRSNRPEQNGAPGRDRLLVSIEEGRSASPSTSVQRIDSGLGL